MKRILFIGSVFAIMSMSIVNTGCNSKAKQQEADSIAKADSIARVDSIARADSIAAAENLLGQAPDKIKDFYRDYVFGSKIVDDEVAKTYFSEKLAKKLTDAYEYEGGGYAVWLFRSGAQDGDFEATALTDVEVLGEGKFKACYLDMGKACSVVISTNIINGNLVFDNIE